VTAEANCKAVVDLLEHHQGAGDGLSWTMEFIAEQLGLELVAAYQALMLLVGVGVLRMVKNQYFLNEKKERHNG